MRQAPTPFHEPVRSNTVAASHRTRRVSLLATAAMSLSAIAVLAAVTAVALGGCSSEAGAPRVTRSDSAGMEIVLSTGDDTLLPWELEPLFSLGGAAAGPETFHSVVVSSVDVDAQGRIFVLDRRDHRVVAFDSQGEFLLEMGGEGGGPGEFRIPVTMDVGPDGTIAVFDFGKGHLVRFTSEGEILPESPFQINPPPGPHPHFRQMETAILVSARVAVTEPDTRRQALQIMSPQDTVELADRSYPRAEMVMYRSCAGGLALEPLFDPEFAWAANDHGIILSRTDGYALEVREGETLVRSIRRELKPRPATRGMALAELGEGLKVNFGSGPCTIPPEEMVEDRGFAETLPWIRQITLAPSGELWVWRREVGPDTQGPIDVFDPSGAYLGTLPPGTPFPLVFLDESRFGAAVTDEFDITRLAVYEVNRADPGPP